MKLDKDPFCLTEEFSFNRDNTLCHKKFDCSNLGYREKKIHQYLTNLSKAIGFIHEDPKTVSLYDLPGILSTPVGVAGEDIQFLYEKLPQSFVYTRCGKNHHIDLGRYKCCLLGWEIAIDQKIQTGRKIGM